MVLFPAVLKIQSQKAGMVGMSDTSLPVSEGILLSTSSQISLICFEFVTSICNVISLLLVTDFKLCSPSFVKQAANT